MTWQQEASSSNPVRTHSQTHTHTFTISHTYTHSYSHTHAQTHLDTHTLTLLCPTGPLKAHVTVMIITTKLFSKLPGCSLLLLGDPSTHSGPAGRITQPDHPNGQPSVLSLSPPRRSTGPGEGKGERVLPLTHPGGRGWHPAMEDVYGLQSPDCPMVCKPMGGFHVLSESISLSAWWR